VSAAERRPGLDLLRAIAIAWVLLYHASLFNLVSQDFWIVRFGWMGVDLFFVLSGYLIGGQLMRPHARGETPDYRRFLMRRALRTLPTYWAIVALYFLVPEFRERSNIQPVWQFLTFTQNLTLDFPLPKAFSQAWSLCVEEQFYLALPLIIALLAVRPSAAKTIGAMLAVLIAGMVLRGTLWLHDVAAQPFDPASYPRPDRYMNFIYYPTWSRLDGLLAGVAAAAVEMFRWRWRRFVTIWPNLLLAAGVAGVGAAIMFFHVMIAGFLPSIFGFPLLAISMMMLVIGASDGRSIIGSIEIPGAAALAAGAYSLYLTNKMAFHAVQVAARDWPEAIQSLAPAIGLICALAAGAICYWAVERPFLKLRDRLVVAPRGSAARTAA
jgi:peptidoglycan/LPS O-acetylase OafA/YrhL